VIVSVVPFAQTQLRVGRPKRSTREGSILSGCLAWYPCVKDPSHGHTNPKLVYTWDNYLAIRSVVEIPRAQDAQEGPPQLSFPLQREWLSEEPIVSTQWLLPSVLVVLTVSQRLLVLDTSAQVQVTASCDLLMRQIIHFDRFSSHMNTFPAVADAYYPSFKTYKHRIFLLVLSFRRGLI
jgi:vacuolar protein sorting-associated protein 8